MLPALSMMSMCTVSPITLPLLFNMLLAGTVAGVETRKGRLAGAGRRRRASLTMTRPPWPSFCRGAGP